jgi:hypothetical protein
MPPPPFATGHVALVLVMAVWTKSRCENEPQPPWGAFRFPKLEAEAREGALYVEGENDDEKNEQRPQRGKSGK